MNGTLDATDLRNRLGRARVLLLFTPELAGTRDPLAVLEAVLDQVDIVQVRPKRAGQAGPCEARATFDWTVRVLERVRVRPELEVLVLVDDRVDVAQALADRGCAGVHLGADDMPPTLAREQLGPAALIGFSTHSLADVIAVDEDASIDYLGFGPVHPTDTKGYKAGLGSENAWIAHGASSKPLFPIGGIGVENAHELARVGRAAVAAAILSAPDPARAARELRAALGETDSV